MRIGHGYDVHRLVKGRRLVLGGVEIEYELGLLGHSDADVLLHALTDAILGAAAAGDIGRLFPDSDARYTDADSLELLKAAYGTISNKYTLVNADVTIVAQRPKIAPYIELMRQNIAGALGVDIGCISVKGTTEEGLGFTGSGEGIAAHAVALLQERI
ncbi:MAG: 2-C-methyl-D-erythritol 2,4-cyclodiphosphate synthase [Oscillospiraceae bacterium]|nr:2-C-methyl-D-erythritol 2,4-cyclodiphosphate synthase [Oscillospiraceae bacterium]